MSHSSSHELADKLKLAQEQVKVGGIYAHYKDPFGTKIYEVVGLVIIESTEDIGVLYKPLYNQDLQGVLWVRPMSDWTAWVSFEGKSVPRFKLLPTS